MGYLGENENKCEERWCENERRGIRRGEPRYFVRFSGLCDRCFEQCCNYRTCRNYREKCLYNPLRMCKACYDRSQALIPKEHRTDRNEGPTLHIRHWKDIIIERDGELPWCLTDPDTTGQMFARYRPYTGRSKRNAKVKP